MTSEQRRFFAACVAAAPFLAAAVPSMDMQVQAISLLSHSRIALR
jgi:hypothetical protein